MHHHLASLLRVNSTAALAFAFVLVLGLASGTPAFAQFEEEEPSFGLPDTERRSAENVIRAYYTFISTGQFREALDLLGPSFDVTPVRQIASDMRDLNQKIRRGEVTVSLERVRELGDWALAVLVIEGLVDNTRKKFVADQYLLNLGNRWTVVPRQLRESNSFASFYNNNAVRLNTWWKENQLSLNQALQDG